MMHPITLGIYGVFSYNRSQFVLLSLAWLTFTELMYLLAPYCDEDIPVDDADDLEELKEVDLQKLTRFNVNLIFWGFIWIGDSAHQRDQVQVVCLTLTPLLAYPMDSIEVYIIPCKHDDNGHFYFYISVCNNLVGIYQLLETIVYLSC